MILVAGGLRVHMFNKGISPKGKIMMRLEFELTYFDATVQYFTHYATGTHTGNYKFLSQLGRCIF